ncbi:MAG: serine hydrolase domain-containing protein [Limnochordia bacterium]
MHRDVLVTGTPADASLRPDHIEAAYALVERWCSEQRIPGAVLAIGHRGFLVGPKAFGLARLQPQQEVMRPDTIFDLASVTKVVAAAPCVLALLERGMLWLNDSVRRYIPEAKLDATIGQLLTHTSGLPAASLYQSADPLQALWDLAPNRPPGEEVIYSCPGFIMLGEVVKRVSGRSLNVLAKELFYDPLGMHDTQYTPPPSVLPRVAPTGFNAELGTHLHGVVHDNNCRSLGGVCGNAGLFGSAGDIAVFCQMWLNKGCYEGHRVLSEAVVDVATRNYTRGMSQPRGLGWQMKGDYAESAAGDLFSPESFGHTGFTGTFMWIDPTRELFVVLLTNRVHLRHSTESKIRLRPLVANLVAAAVIN